MVGAGPAGSLTALTLAQAGASVLLVDRARFPRDKPCGGGLTLRAVGLLPFALGPVVEDVIDRLEVRFRYGSSFERECARPIAVMTRRSRLDAFLAERAAAAGADFRDGVRVIGVESGPRGATVHVGGRRLHTEAVIGADGANGLSARSLGLCGGRVHGIALEGNVPVEHVDASRYRGRIVFELGVVRGGYGWVFPKGDHVNVGVGGWERAGPTLRGQLARLCGEHAIPVRRLQDVRGHRLPVRRPDAVLARGRGLVAGDAAGLVDPLSGDGIFEAFLSARLAARATSDLLAGHAADLTPYDAALRAALGRLTSNAWAAKLALDLLPRLMFAVARTEHVQRGLERLARGETGPAPASPLARAPLGLLGALVRGAGDAGHALATAAAGRSL